MQVEDYVMDEERLNELEEWALSERSRLTDSENVLLDAIAEACLAVRQERRQQESHREELHSWREKVRALRDELRRDREAMEGADLELAVGDDDSRAKARRILSGRLDEQAEPE